MRNEAYWRFKTAGTCIRCGKRRIKGSVYCSKHREYHRDYAREDMRQRRASDPGYRERERIEVRERMRRLRATPGYQRPDM